MYRLRNTFTALAAGLVVATALSGAAVAREYYGSIAYSPGTGAIGYIHDQTTKQNAIDGALEGCYAYADDCVTAINFWNGSCGAVAVGSSGGWGAGFGTSASAAQSAAMKVCNARDYDCGVKRYQCTSKAR